MTGHVHQKPGAGPFKGQLGSLQALRAIAALIVVLFHMNSYTLQSVLGHASLWDGLNMGYAGVEIFFVLSGFIMFYIHASEFGRPDRFGHYLLKRVTRIYPFFWIVLAAVIVLRFLGGDALPSGWSIFVSATLLPFQDAHLLGVQWTLSYEMMFYLIFSICILSARIGIVVGAFWFLACAVAALTGYSGVGADFLLSAYNLLFLFGIFAAYYWERLRSKQGLLLALGVLLFFGTGFCETIGGYTYYKPLRTVLFGLGATAIIMSLVSLEAVGRLRAPQWLVFLGDASYAIYLVHITVMSVTARILLMLGLDALPSVILVAVLFLAAVLGGAVAHVVLEKPVTTLIRKLTRPRVATTRTMS